MLRGSTPCKADERICWSLSERDSRVRRPPAPPHSALAGDRWLDRQWLIGHNQSPVGKHLESGMWPHSDSDGFDLPVTCTVYRGDATHYTSVAVRITKLASQLMRRSRSGEAHIVSGDHRDQEIRVSYGGYDDTSTITVSPSDGETFLMPRLCNQCDLDVSNSECALCSVHFSKVSNVFSLRKVYGSNY